MTNDSIIHHIIQVQNEYLNTTSYTTVIGLTKQAMMQIMITNNTTKTVYKTKFSNFLLQYFKMTSLETMVNIETKDIWFLLHHKDQEKAIYQFFDHKIKHLSDMQFSIKNTIFQLECSMFPYP